MTGTMPHVPYIEAVTAALTAAGLEPGEVDVRDSETRGVYPYLDAVITLDPSGSHDLPDEEIPAGTPWRHGLLLLWEWHTGAEEGGPEEGPIWQFAELKADGASEYPTDLPVYGYAAPAAVVDAARKVIDRRITPDPFSAFGAARWNGGLIGGTWERTEELDAACKAWGAEEVSE
ncbi:hypothetical protein [Streptomyces mexicanus]|uniref:hypothetical protein n=1 Tax=Streptomyces mexicanus TaxID=178566 RepID=UPI0036694DAF